MEVWKDIPGYEFYQVSSIGRVKSLKYGKERILSTIFGNGYVRACLCIKCNCKRIGVHQLMMMAFKGHVRDGHNTVVDHINGIRHDNRLENLQLLTNRQNCSRKKSGDSKYTGVSWLKKNKKWMAKIYYNGKQKYIGSYLTELEAHNAHTKYCQINKII